ncbi:MAG: DUF5716 family protein [Lachnospiraceae bacterium]|nr:DUF5716 family protein [Lachnospiraceae bacterium]
MSPVTNDAVKPQERNEEASPARELSSPLFDIIPPKFFSPLSSPNRLVYWDCIHKLFSVMDTQLSFGIEREILADELQFYFEQNQAAEFEEAELAAADPRKKANEMLRLLENFGWIEVETDKSYVQRVNFYDYAVNIIKTLLEISDGKKVEYQGYIYSIYGLVKESEGDPAAILVQIREQTDLLITGLKNLNSNIKHYIDELTRHKTVAEIMNALFNDYITNIVDKAYHRLRTSDNVSKFRPEIIERLEAHGRSKTYLSKTAEALAKIKEISLEKAEELTYQYLHEIIEAFRSMDDILMEIDQKNTQYQRAAINRAKFLLAGSEDVRGQLKEILLYMNEKVNDRSLDLNGIYELEYMDELVRLFGSSFLDEKSFYSPAEGKKEFHPQELSTPEQDLLLRQEKLKRMTEKMQKILSPERIDSYVKAQMGERRLMRASELPLQSVEDFMKIIYIRLYGTRKNMIYRIQKETNLIHKYEEYSFPDYTIQKKEK